MVRRRLWRVERCRTPLFWRDGTLETRRRARQIVGSLRGCRASDRFVQWLLWMRLRSGRVVCHGFRKINQYRNVWDGITVNRRVLAIRLFRFARRLRPKREHHSDHDDTQQAESFRHGQFHRTVLQIEKPTNPGQHLAIGHAPARLNAPAGSTRPGPPASPHTQTAGPARSTTSRSQHSSRSSRTQPDSHHTTG